MDTLIIRSRGKFGNNLINREVKKLQNGGYPEPEKVIWQFIKEGRIDPTQFISLLQAYKQHSENGS